MEIAKALAVAGALVLVNGRGREDLERAISAITSAEGSALPLRFDVADEGAVRGAFDTIQDEHKRLDILVNNVGARDRRGLFDLDTDRDASAR